MKSLAARRAIAGTLIAIVGTAAGIAAQTQGQPGQLVYSGAVLFTSYCATCHGANGTGDGPLGKMLRKAPANLTQLARKNGGVFSPEMVARSIDGSKPLAGHGGGDMPAWGDAFGRSADGPDSTPNKIQALVKYLETIQKP
jgi:mono/diheme cytochrome c family protein